MTGDIIREKRLALGWTQEELAQRLGYKDKTAINKIETNKNGISSKKLAHFAEVLGCDPAELIADIPHKKHLPTHILKYAALLSELPPDALDNAMQYIEYLSRKGDKA